MTGPRFSDDDKVATFYCCSELNVRYFSWSGAKIKGLTISIQGRVSPTRNTPGITKYFLKLELTGLSIMTTIFQRKI